MKTECHCKGEAAVQKGLFTQESQWHPLCFICAALLSVRIEVMHNYIRGSDLGEALPEDSDILELWGRSSLPLAKDTMTPGVLLQLGGTKGNTGAKVLCWRHW